MGAKLGYAIENYETLANLQVTLQFLTELTEI